MKNIAIITARSGSKGLKDKNIRILNGKPLMAYTIEAAIKSGMFDEIMVSTDSKEYASVAIKYGAKVPFLRTKKNSDDNASSWDVVKEVVKKYKDMGKEFNTVCMLQPTSPLRIAEDIVNGYKLFNEKKADTVIAVCKTQHSPLWSNTLDESNCMKGFISDDILNCPRQKLQQYYRINGALYIRKISTLYNEGNMYDCNCYAYVMPRERSVDIDTMLDFRIAQAMMER